MAIHLIIDGYNLIGSEKGLRSNIEAKRNQLIRELQQYQERKGYPITVVFDGWRSGWIHEVEERPGGMTVIFSRQGEKADSVIQRLAREMGSRCVVVSSDREIRRAAEASGAVAIYSGEFGAKLRNLSREITEDDDPLTPYWADRGRQRQRKSGNPRRLSKAERRRRERLRKL